MLGKLMKQEFIASYRLYLPVYGALYLLSLLIYFSVEVQSTYISTILIFMFALLLGALGIFTFYTLVTSLGTRMYGKPGYLLFSVPASTSQVMLSKYITNFLWILATGFVGITSLSIAFSLLGVQEEIGMLLAEIYKSLDLSGLNIFMIIVFGIVFISYYIAFFMFLFALLNLIYKGERRILMGVLLYMGLSFVVNQLVGMLSLGVFSMVTEASYNALWYVTLIYFVFGAAMFTFSYVFMNKKMELK